jgi:ATP-dependent protease ClpP protease subunit/regulator of replication initiation timing
MNLKFVKNLKEDAATMLLYREIGSNGIDGAAFAEEMYWLSKNVPLINVRINSPGGSIFEGYSIYSAMREVGVPVDTYNDFIAASMGGIIFEQGRKRYASDNSLLMLHNPQGGGSSQKDKEILGLLKNSLVDSYTSRTGTDGKIISDLMDVETWVEARKVNGVSAMLEMGLADELFKSSVKLDPKAQVFNVSKLYSYSNNILNKDKMENEKIEQLAKQVSDLMLAVENLTKEKASKDAEIVELKNTLESKETILKDANDKAAVEFVENLIKDGKAIAEKKDSLIIAAKNNLSILKEAYDSIPASTASRFTNVVAATSKVVDVRNDWTIRDYEEQDPTALAEMFKNDNEKYTELYNKYYKN